MVVPWSRGNYVTFSSSQINYGDRSLNRDKGLQLTIPKAWLAARRRGWARETDSLYSWKPKLQEAGLAAHKQITARAERELCGHVYRVQCPHQGDLCVFLLVHLFWVLFFFFFLLLFFDYCFYISFFVFNFLSFFFILFLQSYFFNFPLSYSICS